MYHMKIGVKHVYLTFLWSSRMTHTHMYTTIAILFPHQQMHLKF